MLNENVFESKEVECKRCGKKMASMALLMHELRCSEARKCTICNKPALPAHHQTEHQCENCGEDNVIDLQLHKCKKTCKVCQEKLSEDDFNNTFCKSEVCDGCNVRFTPLDLAKHVCEKKCRYCLLKKEHDEIYCNKFVEDKTILEGMGIRDGVFRHTTALKRMEKMVKDRRDKEINAATVAGPIKHRVH